MTATHDPASETALPLGDPTTGIPLPADDPALFVPGADLDMLVAHWAPQAALPAMTGEEMRGADARAQRLGTPGAWLMEQAGIAVAAAARALLVSGARPSHSRLLVLCGPGNNGGDGLVAARHLARLGIGSEVVLLASEGHPMTADARLNWDRLDGVAEVHRVVTGRSSDVALYHNGIERAGLIIDALLGTGIRGPLREPIRTAVDVAARAREHLVPVLAVDTPTSVDLTSGEPSDPVVRADVTITFHRPKLGLRSRAGRVLAGLVLVAPIGIPRDADRS
jgi:ADP-dependent NAD(P)H-hydrate dehydratase / NAD(P)H-hydrate epimerase